MLKFSTVGRKLVITLLLLGAILPTSGCLIVGGLADTAIVLARFWQTTPLIPVPAYWSQQIEQKYHEEEFYNKVPILDPVEGENAPIFCLDPPTADEVMLKLPDDTGGGLAFISETSRNNVRMVVELIVDRVDDPKIHPTRRPCKTPSLSLQMHRLLRQNHPIRLASAV